MYEMIFGKYGWIRVGESWLYKWSIQFQVSVEDFSHYFEGEFQYHRVSDVSRGILFMAEDLKIFLYENLQIWEGNFAQCFLVLLAACKLQVATAGN